MINLKKLTEEYVDFRVELLNNPSVNKYLNVNEFFTRERTKQWLNNLDSSQRYDCVFMLDNVPIGMGGLSNISKMDKNAELYMYLSPDFQGKGLVFLSLSELCKYGFDVLGLEKIFLYTFADNVRANNLYEKCGFKREACLRNHKYHKGQLVDRYIYGLLKLEFNK